MFVRILAALALACLLFDQASACTLWALSGQEVQGGGTFIAKNRDFTPDHPNVVAVVSPEAGYRMLALVSVNPEGKKSLVGGVNERGLAVVTATVGTLAKKERLARTRENGLRNAAREILSRCSSVAELAGRPEVLASLGPVFALVADAREVAVLESAGGVWRLRRVPQGNAAAHTNHPLSTDFPEIRSREDPAGSVARFHRIQALMDALPRPVAFRDFTALSLDRAGGPDQSLFRTGSDEKKPRTLATMAASLPTGGRPPEVFVRLTNPGAAAQEKTFVLDGRFWNDAPAPGRMRQVLP